MTAALPILWLNNSESGDSPERRANRGVIASVAKPKG